MPTFDLESLALFVQVVNEGSINAAAAAAERSQQSVSVRMRKLEQELGLTLLARGSRGSHPTETGILVAEWAAEFLAAQDAFSDRLAALRAERTSNLPIAASQTIAGYLLPGWLIALRAQSGIDSHPHVRAVNSHEVIAQVHAGEVDLGFIESFEQPDGLQQRIIGQDELVVVVAPEHEWAGREHISIETLAATPLVVREEGSGTRQVLETLLAQSHPNLKLAEPAAEFSAVMSVRNAVAAGMGPSVMSMVTVGDDLAAGRLVRVAVAGMQFRRPFTAIWREEQPLGTMANTLVSLAAQALGNAEQ
nr:LysR family transcriptional regulator [Pseudoclavibacter sp. Marseille-Q3772]